MFHSEDFLSQVSQSPEASVFCGQLCLILSLEAGGAPRPEHTSPPEEDSPRLTEKQRARHSVFPVPSAQTQGTGYEVASLDASRN